MSAFGRVGREIGLLRSRFVAWRPDWAWVAGVLRSFLVSFLALAASLWLLPGEQVTRGAQDVATLVVVVLLVGALLRPLLVRFAVLTGTLGLLVVGLLGQALILGVALSLVPGVRPFTFGDVVVASWAATVTAAFINWIFDASSDEAFYGQVLGHSMRVSHRFGRGGRGLLVVQLDGVSEPLVRQAITSGAMPTLSRWLRDGSHEMRRWHTGLPATTPAGQALLLYGDADRVPSFRWYDKDRRRMVQASQAADMARLEAQLSEDDGLLSDRGVSVSTLFSGGAETRLLTLSEDRLPRIERGAASYAAGRAGFVRSVVLFAGQVVAEWYQGRRQARRDVRPRVRRSGVFLLLRGLTTVLLHDLNVSVVAEHMGRGAPSIFVDFVDYDEVAHHAGPSRPESMRTLESLDRVLGFFTEVAEQVSTTYDIVVVSDHGQTQGTPFRQLTGRTLAEYVDGLSDCRHSTVTEEPPERSGAAAMLAGPGRPAGRLGAVARYVAKQPEGDDAPHDVVVAPSGNLALLYLAGHPGVLSVEQIDAARPGLVGGLVASAEIGLVVGRTTDGALRVLSHGATCEIRNGQTVLLEGEADPLAPYGERAAADLVALAAKRHSGDLILIGRYDPALGEVVVFEELVGSHGGLGGWQTDALFVYPSEWSLSKDASWDGRSVHRVLRDRVPRRPAATEGSDTSERPRTDAPAPASDGTR